MQILAKLGFGLALAGVVSAPALAQLLVTPGHVATTAAGTGVVGYSGDNGAAATAALASPSAVAYDTAGNLFVADTANHVIREVLKSSGAIVTVAGSGIAGFAGDGGAATSALLDTPTGIAVDGSGTLYIADSHNHRIRRVSGGVITTFAGTGTAGFSGDGAAAAAAQLASPQGVAGDASGNLYVADTGNNRVRKVAGGSITTVAGTGEQGFTGDGTAAITATLDSPTSVAVDVAGSIYVADRHNQRVRVVGVNGIISTFAGNGAPSFAGDFSGDGALATAAALSRPTGVNVDATGNVYITDTGNQRVRTVTGGVVITAAGSGEQGFTNDGGTLNATVLNNPRAAAVDATGNLSIADTGNERVRSAADALVSFAATSVGVPSATQTITLTNIGSTGLAANVTVTGPFTSTAASTCSSPIRLSAAQSCTEVLTFTATTPGAASGSLTFTGPGATPQTLLLAGMAAKGSAGVTLTSSATASFVNQATTFSAALNLAGAATPTGTVSFFANNVLLGAPAPVVNGVANLTTAFTSAGTYAVTAVYAGDGNFSGASSSALAQFVGDFSFTLTSDQNQGQAVVPGSTVTYKFSVAPLNGPFTFPITLSASGLPSGATVTFNPNTVTLGANATSFTMTVQTPTTTSALERSIKVLPMMALLTLPFAGSLRRRRPAMRSLLVLAVSALSLLTMVSLSGCGSGSGFLGSPQRTYSISVSGTASNAQGATLQRVSTVQLTIQ